MLEIVFPSVYNLWIGRTGKAGSFRQRWDDNPWKKFFDVILKKFEIFKFTLNLPLERKALYHIKTLITR